MKKIIMILLFAIILISSLSIINAGDSDVNIVESDISTVADNSQDISQGPGENSNSQNSSLNGAYLVLDNDADKENIRIGDYLTWIIEVQNFGPEISKNTKVYDKLPDGLEYVRYSATKGTFDSITGIWDIGDLSIEDGIVKLFIITKAITAGEKVNEAYVTSDTVNTNNETYEKEEIDVFEDDDDVSFEKHASAKMLETGNPVFLIFALLFVLIIPIIKK